MFFTHLQTTNSLAYWKGAIIILHSNSNLLNNTLNKACKRVIYTPLQTTLVIYSHNCSLNCLYLSIQKVWNKNCVCKCVLFTRLQTTHSFAYWKGAIILHSNSNPLKNIFNKACRCVFYTRWSVCLETQQNLVGCWSNWLYCFSLLILLFSPAVKVFINAVIPTDIID